MTEEKRFIITRVQLAQTASGREIANLFSHDTRLRFPVLVLFNLEMLKDVEIDPNTLSTAKPHHCKFSAVYQDSEKLTNKGNPYRDVLYLSPLEQLAPRTAAAATPELAQCMAEMLNELRQIRRLVARLLDPKASQDNITDLVTSDPVTRTKPDAELSQDDQLSTNDARQAFYALAGPAIASNSIPSLTINDLVRAANNHGWEQALANLQALL